MGALEKNDTEFLRNASIYYYSISGIYARFVKYLAGLLTYNWYAYPYLLDGTSYNENKVKKQLNSLLLFLDNFNPQITLYNIATQVILHGVYYGYFIMNKSKTQGVILELPEKYCRSRYNVNGIPAVEFNLKYFDTEFTDQTTRTQVLAAFPKEFQKAYQQAKKGQIPTDKETRGWWFLLNPSLAMRFTLNTTETPIFAAVIPTILELEKAKELDMKKTMQQLLKIVVQKMPLDKNDELVFDMSEMLDMHRNLCAMLADATNVDVLTTPGVVEAIDLDNTTATSTNDPLAKVERGIFNEAGISQMLFATDGNIALEKSIMNDEALMFYLLQQFEQKLNQIIAVFFNTGKDKFKISLPLITIYNKEKLQKLYKEMAQAGYSKLLPAIAADMTQTEFISLNEYENNILKLNDKMIPVQISSTQSGKASSEGTGKVGAPEKSDDEKAEKTIQNKESMS